MDKFSSINLLFISQMAPKNPSAHVQIPAEHVPLFWQGFGEQREASG